MKLIMKNSFGLRFTSRREFSNDDDDDDGGGGGGGGGL